MGEMTSSMKHMFTWNPEVANETVKGAFALMLFGNLVLIVFALITQFHANALLYSLVVVSSLVVLVSAGWSWFVGICFFSHLKPVWKVWVSCGVAVNVTGFIGYFIVMGGV